MYDCKINFIILTHSHTHALNVHMYRYMCIYISVYMSPSGYVSGWVGVSLPNLKDVNYTAKHVCMCVRLAYKLYF